jgi:hypothetical protein
MSKSLKTGCWLLAVLLLAGCQPTAENKAEMLSASKVAPVASAAVVPTASPPPAISAKELTGYHRYRGTVGSQPVIVELTIARASKAGLKTCSGSYYYEKHGGQLNLQSVQAFGGGALLILAESAGEGQPPTAHWQAQLPVGPAWAGTWVSTQGRRLPFALQEDYIGAVRYEIVALHMPRNAEPADDETPITYHSDSLTTEFLHLLGPDTLRPAWRRLQCPAPAQRLAAASDASADTRLSVTLNGYGLLSYMEWESEEIGGAYPDNHSTPYTYDLATGRACDPRDWLVPGHETALRQLLTRHMLADSMASGLVLAPSSEDGVTRPYLAPLGHFGLNSAGLYCTLEEFGAPHAIQGVEITIPYIELRHLVRPGTPLARLLAARHL